MTIFGISDLHLSLEAKVDFNNLSAALEYKPMVVFGEQWRNNLALLYENWQAVVKPEDTVLLPGDLSWGMFLRDCTYDFDFLSKLNGTLLLSKGNHDYWWDSFKKVAAALPSNVRALQHQCVVVEEIAIAATRGWLCPGSKDFEESDQKIFARELIRLEMALQEGVALKSKGSNFKEQWVMLHFRPTNDKFEKNEIIEMLQSYGVSKCFYGHLHGNPPPNPLLGEHWGIDFQLLSSDYLGFMPLKLN